MLAKKLEKSLILTAASKDGLIRISITDGDPQRAADMANGYVEEFKKFFCNPCGHRSFTASAVL